MNNGEERELRGRRVVKNSPSACVSASPPMNVMGPCSALYESGPAVTCMRPLRISVQLREGDGIQ